MNEAKDVTPTTLPVPVQFVAFCKGHRLTPEQVLAAFMADLAETADSNGSDERMHADAWFDRVVWPEPPERTFTVEPRTAELGGGWKLRLLSDGEEAGGGVFPADPNEDPQAGKDWWNGLPEDQRAGWMAKAGNTGRAVDAYGAFLAEEAHDEAEQQGWEWEDGV